MVALKGMELQTDCQKCPLMATDGADELSPMMCIALWATEHEVKHCVKGKILDDCPLVEVEEPRWISTSEKLPQPNEYEGNVCKYHLVQDDTGDMYVAHYTRKGWHPIDTLFFLNNVVAWMPLPERYEYEGDK